MLVAAEGEAYFVGSIIEAIIAPMLLALIVLGVLQIIPPFRNINQATKN